MALIPETYQAYFVMLVIFLLFFSIYQKIVKPAIGFILAVTLFILGGILKPEEALLGLSNVSIATIALLIIISSALRRNFKIEVLFDRLFKNTKSYPQFLLMMMAKVALLSSFINNTPVVTIMAPYVYNWGKKNNISPSKLLIPLSYATIFGGMITIIGTSTTLILVGLISEQNLTPIPFTYFLILGLVVTVTGITFMVGLGTKLLPDRKDSLHQFEKNKREYLIERRLQPNSKLIGKRLDEAGLRNLDGVYLVEIIRGREIISPVPPEFRIESNDILIFAGNTDRIIDLSSSDMGITLPASKSYENLPEVQVVEAVVSTNSFLVSKTIKSSNFRARFDAAVVAIHRNGEKLSGKLGDIVLQVGDVLLLYTGNNFQERVQNHKDLFILTGASAGPIRSSALPISLFSLASFSLIPLGYSTLFSSLLLIFCFMFFKKMVNIKHIKNDLDINVFVILAFSITMGTAMIKSGAGSLIATGMVELFAPFGTLGMLIGLALLTTLLTSFISNVGAISIMYPIAYGLSTTAGIPHIPIMLVIAYSASCAFITPMGYQTNLIVYGPGNYNFKDFAKIGLPVTFVYLLAMLIGIVLLFPSVMS